MASDMSTEVRPGVRRVVTGHRAADGVAVVKSDNTMPYEQVRTYLGIRRILAPEMTRSRAGRCRLSWTEGRSAVGDDFVAGK